MNVAERVTDANDHEELVKLRGEVSNLKGWVRSIDGRLWLILITSLGALVAGLAHH